MQQVASCLSYSFYMNLLKEAYKEAYKDLDIIIMLMTPSCTYARGSWGIPKQMFGINNLLDDVNKLKLSPVKMEMVEGH